MKHNNKQPERELRSCDLDQVTLTPLQCPVAGDCSGVTDSLSIMFTTVSGTLVISQHFSCQLGSFKESISLALETQSIC